MSTIRSSSKARKFAGLDDATSKVDQMDNCDLATSVPDWLIDYPQLLPLFKRLNIDYCCGGKSLESACREQELKPAQVLAQIHEILG